jgi:transcriptional regulator with XRE-family HTH domain
MQFESKPRYLDKRITKTVFGLKAARIYKGLSRKAAAELCGCTPKAFEQLENGRVDFTEERIRRLLEKMSVSWIEFQDIQDDPKRYLAHAKSLPEQVLSRDKKPRRNTYKLITKEVRIIRILRLRKGYSQEQASALCGYARCEFGHIERGRLTPKPDRLQHILNSLNCTRAEFDALMVAPILRDDLIESCNNAIQKLDDSKLESALSILNALIK